MEDILFEGSKRARVIAKQTMERVRRAVRITVRLTTVDFESSPDSIDIRLENFEGPLDLLLHLIKKNEVDIADIPIALITAQYPRHDPAHGGAESLDVAGEFLVDGRDAHSPSSRRCCCRGPETAATVEGDVEDPRDVLVRRLIEHQRFKAAAGLLHEREQVRAAQWQRPDERVAALTGDDYEPELEVDLFSLLNAFQAVVERMKHRPRSDSASR